MPTDPDLIARFNNVLTTAPHLVNNPGVAVPLALNPAAAPHIPAIAGFDRGQQITASLIRLPADQEIRAWNELGEAEKSLAKASGYRGQFEREEEKKSGGWKSALGFIINPKTWVDVTADSVGGVIDDVWNHVVEPFAEATTKIPSALLPDFFGEGVGKVGEAIEPAKDPVTGGLKNVGGGALDAYGWVTGKTDQLYRAGKMAAGDIPGPFDDVPGVGVIAAMGQNLQNFVIGDFSRWWDEADRKNMPVDPGVEKDVRERYGDRIADLVRRQQRNPEDLLNQRARLIGEGKQDEAAELDETLSSPTFQAALAGMDRGLLSPGRDFARSVGLPEGELFDTVSGTTDGLYRVMTDPLLVGGQGVSGFRAAKYGLAQGDAASAAARVDQLFTTPRVQRYFDDAGKHLEEIRNPSELGSAQRAVQQLERNFKALTPALREGMVKAGVSDAASASAYLKEAEGYTFLISGRAAFGRPLMPYRTAVRKHVYEQMARAPRGVVDWIAAGPKIVRDDLLLGADDAAKLAGLTRVGPAGEPVTRGMGTEVSDAVRAANAGWRGRSATAHRRLTTHLPSLTGNNLDLMAPGADAQVQRIAAMFGPKYWARQVGVTFMHANEVGRRDIVKGLYATMFEATGVTKTAPGREWATRFFKTMDDSTAGTYTVTGLGRNPVTGQSSAVFLADARPYLPVPNFAEVYAQAAKLGASKTMLDTVNAPMVDWYMNTVWRPSVLLRPALAFRNSLDEALNQYIREPGKLVSGHLGVRALNRRQLAASKAAEDAAYDARMYVAQAENDLRVIYGENIDDLASRAVALRAEAVALRTQREGAGPYAGVGSAEKRRGTRQEHRGERKAQADRLDAEAGVLQDHANGLAAARQRALEARLRAAASPDGFDTEMGRMFRGAMSIPHAIGRRLEKNAAAGSTQAKIADVMTNAGRSQYNFYRAHVYGKFAESALRAFSPHTLAAVDDLVDNPYARQLFAAEIMETSIRSSRMQIDNAAAMATKNGSAFAPGKVRVNGEWGKVTAQGDDGADSWHLWFDKAAEDPVGKHMLLHLDDQEAAIAGAVRIINDHPEYLNRMSIVRDVGPERFAAGMFQEIKTHVSTTDGRLIPGLVEKMRYGTRGSREINKDAFSVSALRAIPNGDRPEWVLGLPGMWMETAASPTQRLVQSGFKAVGDMTAYMSRQNQFVSAYTDARQLFLPLQNDLIARLGGDKVAEAAVRAKMTRDALDMAVVKATAYVDNPAVRSQAAVLMRNLAPFWRAQEEFFMCWGRAMKYNPESMGRAMLAVHASTASGIVHKDENGQMYFVYPGSGVVHQMMVNVANMFPGALATKIPIASPMTGKVQMLTPGFNPDGTLHIFNSPVLAEPIRFLSRITEDPRFDEFEKVVLGPGADRGFIESNIPALFRPLYQEYAMGDEKHEMNALAAIFSQYGVGEEIPGTKGRDGKPIRVPTQADVTEHPEMVTDFRDLVRRHANGIRLMRSVLGPVLPAYPKITPVSTPDAQAGDNPDADLRGYSGLDSVRQEYFDLVRRLEESGESGGDAFEAAYAYWFKEHPNEIPFIVGQTDVNGSVPLSNAKAAGEFIEGNRDMLERFPKAGLFFIPQGKDFDMKTYKLTMDLGMRETKPLTEYINDLSTSNTVSVYYEEREKFYAQRDAAKAAGNTAEVTRLNKKWSNEDPAAPGYSQRYKALNPLVGDYLAQGQQRAVDRERTFEEMERLLGSGQAPPGPDTDMYRALVTGWRSYQSKRVAITGTTDYDQGRKKTLDARFEKWSEMAVQNSAAGKLFHGRLLRNMEP